MLKALCIFLIFTSGILFNRAFPAETTVIVEAYVTVETVDTSVSDVYIADGWSYTHVRTMPDTRKAGSWGVLIYNNKTLGHTAKINDWYTTPWGAMYWWGVSPFRVSGPHLWQPMMNKDFPMGKRLNPQMDVYK